MYWLAVSFGPPEVALPYQGDAVLGDWSAIERSLLQVRANGTPTGYALPISTNGLYVAHLGVVRAGELRGVTFDGKPVRLSVRHTDLISNLILLVVAEGAPVPGIVFEGPEVDRSSGRNWMLTPAGPVNAEVLERPVYGIGGPGRRTIPLREVRFEGSRQTMSKALVMQGRTIVGSVVSSLEPVATATPSIGSALIPNYGPSRVQVIQMTAPSLTRRVLSAFRQGEAMQYPLVGMVCRNSAQGQVEVVSVEPRSPAQTAGIRPGDELLRLGSNPIRNVLDYGRVAIELIPGSEVTVTLRRRGTILTLPLTVAGTHR
jgi:hypothetical protein